MSGKLRLFSALCACSLLLNLLLLCLLLRPRQPEPAPAAPPAVIEIEEVYYGSVVGRGIITDPEEVAVVLDCIDRLEFYADDINLAYMGGGIEVYLYRDGDVKSYTFGDGAQIKDHQDPHPDRWFRFPGESIVPFLEDHIQKTYPYPEFR